MTDSPDPQWRSSPDDVWRAWNDNDKDAGTRVLADILRWLGTSPLNRLREILLATEATTVLLQKLVPLLILPKLLLATPSNHPLHPFGRQLRETAARSIMAHLLPVVAKVVGCYFSPFSEKNSRHLGPGQIRHEIDEVCQAVFARLIVEGKVLRWNPQIAKLSTFVWTIAANTTIDHIRRLLQRIKTLNKATESLSTEGESPPVWPTPAELEKFKNTLSEPNRTIFEMYYQQGFTAKEIAEKLGLPPQDVQARIHGPLRKGLRDRFGPN